LVDPSAFLFPYSLLQLSLLIDDFPSAPPPWHALISAPLG
jgi:hypothetical protein